MLPIKLLKEKENKTEVDRLTVYLRRPNVFEERDNREVGKA